MQFEEDDLYVRYGFGFGPDWSVVDGVEMGLSQIARKAAGPDKRVIFNFPIDVSFKSTNPFGWPRMSISVYGVDGLGRDVVRGYGSILIPLFPGNYKRSLQVYVPSPSSPFVRFTQWLRGSYSEFFDSKFVTRGIERDTVRVEPTGVVNVNFQIFTRNLQKLGYAPSATNSSS